MDIFLAIFFPPLAVLIKGKPISALLNCFLCLFGWLPGIIHAIMIVSKVNNDRKHEETLRAINRK